MTLKIARGVPMPARVAGKANGRLGIKHPRPDIQVYPFARMNIGDSFLLPKRMRIDRTSPLNSAKDYRRRTGSGFQISSKTVAGGIRFWRIA